MKAIIETVLLSIVDMTPRLLNLIWAIMCTPIYGFISLFFDVLTTIPQIDLLSSAGIEGIYQRVTIIITIIMTFYITFESVKYVVQPDIVTDKEKGSGKLALRIMVVIVLIAFMPKIFSIAYELQGKIIDSQLISKVMFGGEKEEYGSLGSDFSADLLGIFYNFNEEACSNGEYEVDSGQCKLAKNIVNDNLEVLRNGGFRLGRDPVLGTFASIWNSFRLNWGLFLHGTATIDGEKEWVPLINFNGLLALVVGVYICWTLIVYGVEVAKRYFQLIFLQITAPIAIVSYISPKKDGTFQKWVRQCTTTYLDLFIRLAIINFILIVIKMLNDSLFNIYEFSDSMQNNISSSAGFHVVVWAYLFLLIGIFQFVKKAPKLLKDLFPSSNAASGEYSMSGKETIGTIKGIIGGTSRAIGGTYGAVIGAKTAITSNNLKGGDKFWSAAKGAFAGAKAGYAKGGTVGKAGAAARGSVHKDEDVARAGGTVLGHDFRGGHYAQEAKQYERQKADYKGASTSMDRMAQQIDEIKHVKTVKKSWEAAKAAGNSEEARLRENQYKALSQAVRTEIVARNLKIDNEGNLIDKNGNRVDQINVNYSYNRTDENGATIGTENDSFHFDSGDKEFMATFNNVAREEERKSKGTALDDLVINIKRIHVDENGNRTEDENATNVRVGDLTPEEFTAYIHKIKDAASIASQTMENADYARATANASSNGNKN